MEFDKLSFRGSVRVRSGNGDAFLLSDLLQESRLLLLLTVAELADPGEFLPIIFELGPSNGHFLLGTSDGDANDGDKGESDLGKVKISEISLHT